MVSRLGMPRRDAAAPGSGAGGLRVLLHKEKHRTAALLDRVAEMSREARRRDELLAAVTARLAAAEARAAAPQPPPRPPAGGSSSPGSSSPKVVASPLASSAESDSPRHTAASAPLGVEALRSRTGRAKAMFRDLDSPARSSSRAAGGAAGPESPAVDDAAAEEPPSSSFVEIAVPEFPDGSRMVTVLLPDGNELQVEVPGGLGTGDGYIIDVEHEARQQRRRLFVEGAATREQLLEEINEMAFCLEVNMAAVSIQAAYRRLRCRRALRSNAHAMLALVAAAAEERRER